ncbi:YgcG family protein [Gluconobacter japonicus]|uniref:TPM domain-containing protein n=1 Tax=Gluconobacter japonicus TaxID=376620 RepID=UPI001B8BECFC|nr:TPM domain-containing protein [Gluconobacter japonicus]MBS1049357.1 TPM domain-containing protein [Gluconobacter japonicus]
MQTVLTLTRSLLTRSLHLVFCALALLCLPLAGTAEAAPLTQFVTDPHDTLSDAERDQLVEKLTTLRETLPSHPHILIDLPGHVEDIDQYANETFHASGIGQKGQDNGLLIVVDIPDTQSRIEVGYGFEGDLTDLHTHTILVAARPDLKAGHYAAALNGMVDTIGETLRKSDTTVKETAAPDEAVSFSSADMLLGGGGLMLFLVGTVLTIRAQRRASRDEPLSGLDRFLISVPWDVLLNLLINILSAAARNNSRGSGTSGNRNSYRSGGGDSGGGGSKDKW